MKRTAAYLRWSRYQGASRWYDRLTSILKDTKRNHNRLSLKAGEDFPAIVREAEELRNKEEQKQ